MVSRVARTSLKKFLHQSRISSSWCVFQSIRRCHNRAEHETGEKYDVIIAGGGMVGTGMLCALGHHSIFDGKKILLLEQGVEQSLDVISPNYSNRVVALNPGTVNFLDDIGVWPKVESKRAKKIENMQVWESCSESMISFQNDSHHDEIAYIVENDVLLSALTEQYKALESENMSIKYKTSISDIHFDDDGLDNSVIIQLHNGGTLRTDLLIGADGANSFVRQKMDVNYFQHNYDQSAIVATLKLSEECTNDTAWQRFLPTGPVALLPLDNETSSLVWSTSKTDCRNLLKMNDEQFIDALNNAIWDNSKKNPFVESANQVVSGLFDILTQDKGSVMQLPPGILKIVENSRASFPLSVGHASNYVKKNIALIGDTAHKVHPLAGQGVNLGYGDVKCLVETLQKAVYDGSTLGDINYLQDYETARQKHVIPTILAIDALKRLYSTDFTPAVLLRSLGLQITNNLPILKKKLMDHAST